MKPSRLAGFVVFLAFVAALIGIMLLLLLSEMPHLFGEWGALVYELQVLQRDLHRGLSDAVRSVEREGLFAVWSLIGLSFLYGVFHAAGPAA